MKQYRYDCAEFKFRHERAGKYFFSASTMAFFKSRILDRCPFTGFFITSEGGPFGNGPRRYTIRKADFETFGVETVGEFQEFETLYKARKQFKALTTNKGEISI